MVNIDLLFVGLIFLTYFSLFRNFSLFKASLLPFYSYEFNKKLDRIRDSNAFIDRVILFSLTKTNDEFQYIYYAKRVIMVLAALFVPWFSLVYFMRWYYIPIFLGAQFIVSVFFMRTPSLLFTLILDAYARRCR